MYYYLNKHPLKSRFPKKKKTRREGSDADLKKYLKKEVKNICSVCEKIDPANLYNTGNKTLCQECYEMKKADGTLDEMFYENEDYGSPKSERCEEMEEFAECLPDLTEAGINNLNLGTEELSRKIREIQVEVYQKQEKIITDFGSPISSSRVVPRWSEDDIGCMPYAMKEYSHDTKKIAHILGNKSEEHVRNYIVANREKLPGEIERLDEDSDN